MQQFAVENLLIHARRLEKAAALASRGPGRWVENAAKAPVIEMLKNIAGTCESAGLLVSSKQANNAVGLMNADRIEHDAFQAMVVALQLVIQDECSTHVFFKIEADRKKHFDDPRANGWREIIDRFPSAISDIEETGKCFALGRYAASVFHSLQIVEAGLIELGTIISISDPKSGFTATANELKRIVSMKFEQRTDWDKQHYEFLEQMHGTVEGLKNAWRNKVSHAQGKLVLMTSDFSGEVAEEILFATRAFMRRLATDLPTEKRIAKGI